MTHRMTKARLEIVLDALEYFETVIEDEIEEAREHDHDDLMLEHERRLVDLRIAYSIIWKKWRR